MRAVGSSVSASAAEAHVDAVVLVPGLVLDRQLAVVELAAQELLRQRRALVGDGQLGREDRHVAVPARLPVAAGGGERGGTAADDQRVACVEAVEVVLVGPAL